MPRIGRVALAALVMSVSLSLMAGSARADDLLVLNGDTQTLSGTQQFGLVYIDGELQLTGDTTIDASSIYIGPDASIDSCYVAGTGGDGCTAGRSLTLDSSGPLTVATGIDLSGGTSTLDPGGNLTLSGGPVAVTSYITTGGTGGSPSGQISISSTGSLAVDGIYAPGAGVSLSASGPIDVGDIQTQGTSDVQSADPTRVQSAGPVTINSSGGDVRIDGTIYAYGRSAPSPDALGGGNGAAVTITGSDVRTQGINTTGGGSTTLSPGGSAPISITARGALNALGQLDASGQDGATGSGTDGSPVTLHSTGPLTIGGNVEAGAGQSAGGGTITVAGSTVTSDDLVATGGNGSSANAAGGPGGSITVTATSGASLGAARAYGGNSQGGAAAGAGGTVSVTSSQGSIAISSAQTQGGYQSSGPGAPGGAITLSADGDLSIGGAVNSDGSDANGAADPPWTGGNAGNLTLRADTGTLSLGGNATAVGGAGSTAQTTGALGGAGGNGGQVEVVAHAIGELPSLSANGGQGGDYGDTQGPGGNGGAILAWTNAPLFNSQQVVSSDGGDGNPTGPAGNQQQDSSPTGLTIDPSTGILGFTSQSPDAHRYQVLMSVGGAAPVTALTTSATSDLHPKAPVCKQVTFTVVAVDSAVPWTSDPSAAVSYLRPPSATQSCSEAPEVAAAAVLHRSLRRLRRSHWIAAVSLKMNGIGGLQATLERGRATPRSRKHGRRRTQSGAKPLATVSLQVVRAGAHVLHIRIPVAARAPGTYSLRLTTTSPNGKDHRKVTTELEIVQ